MLHAEADPFSTLCASLFEMNRTQNTRTKHEMQPEPYYIVIEETFHQELTVIILRLFFVVFVVVVVILKT